MASGASDVTECVDDVIKKLDLTELRSKDGENRPEPAANTTANDVKKNGVAKGDGVAKGTGKDRSGGSSKPSERWKILKEVKVDKLPQRFVCKYTGSKPCTGLWGVRHTRAPADQLVAELRGLPEGDDLPLVNVKISAEGLKATLHVHSRASSRRLPDAGLLPLQFISYAVQDPRYTRLFVFILVREMSSRERKTECHAYLCASDVVARQMALAMALAFGEFSKRLEGKPHRFQVDLRDTEELETELSEKAATGTEFDA